MRARLLFAGLFFLICLPFLVLRADRETVENLAVSQMLGDRDDGLHPALVAARKPGAAAHPLDPERQAGRLRLEWTLEGVDLTRRLEALSSALKVPADSIEVQDGSLEAPLPGVEGPGLLELAVRADFEEDTATLLDAAGTTAAQDRLGSRLSVVPPLFAILLAFLFRSTVLSLFLGCLLGAFLLVPAGHSVLEAFRILFADILWGRVLADEDAFHAMILGFVLFLSATVAVINRMGGIEGMVQALVRYARSSRSVQAVANLMGLAIFFDDYANTIVVGHSAGPLFDRMKVSRARLAYIVDSTAAPVAGIALLSTWVAYQISTYAPQLPTIGRDEGEGYTIFLETIPYRFYCLLALVMVAATIWTRRDFGPMRVSEAEALAGRGGPTDAATGVRTAVERAPGARPRWINGALPLALMILGTAALIYFYGAAETRRVAAEDQDATALAAMQAGGFQWIRAVLSNSDSTRAIFYGSAGALVLAWILALAQRLVPPIDLVRTTGKGLGLLLRNAVLILLFAWTIGAVSKDLGTARYLVSVFQDLMSPELLPVLLFITSCFVAFATGSSWATMAILQPNVVLLADRLGDQSTLGPNGLLVLSIGAVLEGSIFGDHCSPISDTTILSSASSRCNHIEHVRTQAPYALVVAVIALVAGYVPTAFFHFSPWISLALGAAVTVLFLRLVGRRPLPAAAGSAPQAAGQ